MRFATLLLATALGLAGCTLPAPFANLGANSARSADGAQGEGEVDCEDGLTASGAECDGGPDANHDGDDDDGDGDGDVECENGVDASGQPCSDEDTGSEG